MPASKSKSDAEKIASALQAGPMFVARNDRARLSNFAQRRVPASAGWHQWVDLSKGHEPGCFDQVFLRFLKDSIAGRTPNVQSVGISYGGKWVPNKSQALGSRNEFHVGPHIMIIGLDQKMMQTLNQDGSK
jgi:hypothetical protein